jgi:phosphoglycolate phosphatase-like HAD superfamily hydrolase
MKTLVLFDIDGTLVRGGPAKQAFHRALVDAFGTAGDIHVHDFAGKTDPQIARELLTAAGLVRAEVERGFPRLWARYLEELEVMLADVPMQLLPGVTALLDALEAEADVAIGLLTGNIAGGARLKLGSVGIAERFPVGSFGSDHEERESLPRVAIERANRHYGVSFDRDRVVVVGDTPRDVACGLHEGVRTVAVATGRYDVGALLGVGAHAAFSDFTETAEVVACLVERRPAGSQTSLRQGGS